MMNNLQQPPLARLNSSSCRRGRPALARIAFAFGLVLAVAAVGGELAVTDGVVVKFGQDAQLVVRDKLTAGKGVVLTSQNDDAAGGKVAAATQSPVAGTWGGLRFEKSSAPNNLMLSEMTIRYAGAQNGAGLTVLGFNPSLQYLQITDNIIGLQLLQGASPTINGSSFLRNGIGIDADGNAVPVITNSQFAQNSNLAISNRTPVSIIRALGNWWGAGTGPNDPAGNPGGQGDAVSAGVNYGGFLVDAPLINPVLRVTGNPAFSELQNITLELGCVNAVEYRVAENGAFTGQAFQPMTSTVPFTLSAGDGPKKISVQYRSATGSTVTAALPQDLLYDSQGPALSLTNPADGSYILNPITVAATATDTGGVAKVEFYINNQLVATDTSSPYSYNWDTKQYADGSYAIRVVAIDAVGHTTTAVSNVTKAAPPPDTAGPAFGSITLSGTAVTTGYTLTSSGTVVAAVSDPSGVSSVGFLIDGASFATDTNGSDGYSAYVNILGITDGSHTLTIRATDSLGNVSESSTAITVAMAAPGTPVITTPSNNTMTTASTINVSGTAAPNVQVIAYDNAAQNGTPVAVGADGKFTVPVTLVNGSNLIQVAASNRGGLSQLSPSLQVTLDNSIPPAPLGLTASAQAAGKIKLIWNRVLDTKVTGYNLYRSSISFNTAAEAVKVNPLLIPVATTAYDDLPATDGTYFYRLVAVNNLGTPSAPSNIISAVSDNTLPKATEIVYTPTGKTDPATGRVAAGRVDVTVNVSEALSALPFLSIAPQGGTPIPVDLVKQSDTVYTGFFNIAPGTPSGTAYAVFSARDMVGNRGTGIGTGLSIKIDAQGPSLTGIAVTPAAPIKNDAALPSSVAVTLTFSEAMKSGVTPQIGYVLSGSPTVSQTVTGLTQVDPLTWSGNFALPATAGQTAAERLAFSYSGSDDLDNVSTTIMANNNSFQVYQGSLPSLNAPQNMTATAQPGGKVLLGWGAVDMAVAYQIYRQAPGEAGLTAFQRVDVAGLSGLQYTDSTTADGLYRYSVASIRSANGQESLSAQSAMVEVTADSIPPGPPQNLSLMMVGAGVQATWLAPAGGAASYKLYRSSAASITSTAGLTAIITGIKQLGAVDTNPSQAEHAYAATAVDAAGNESALSNSGYLNFSLLPISSLTIVQADTALPQLFWTHPNPSAIAGYDVYLGADTTGTKLNLTPLSVSSYTDTGYAGDARPYTIAAFDPNGVQVTRSLTLPKLGIELVGGTPIQRNVMNRLQYRVTNLGSQAVSGAYMKARIGTREITSQVFGLAAGETKAVDVVVGGYADIPNPAQLATTVEVAPNPGDRADVVRTSSIGVQDGSLVLTVSPQNLTRGSSGKVSFTLENTSDVEIELITASGTAASPDIRCKLLDKDGNVLAAQPFRQSLGNVVTISTGQTVARIPARGSFTSEAMNISVPSSAPDNVTVQVEVDNIRYRLGTPEAVTVPGLSSRQQASLLQTPYYAEVSSIAPASSFGDQDVVIKGRTIDRATQQPLSNAALKLYLNVNGFERSFDVYSDASGNFSYAFKPSASDSGGVYKVSVVHPDFVERPAQGQFVINSVAVSPALFKLSNLRNYPYTFKLRANAGAGTTATNVRVVYDAASQPTGSLPAGVKVVTGAPLTLASGQGGDLDVTITGDNSAAATGSFVLKVMVDEKGAQPVASVLVNYAFTDGKPSIFPSPSFVETGVAQGANVLEQVTLENRGFAEAQGVTATLVNQDGTAAPSWIYLSAGGNVGTLAVGEKRILDIAVTPPATLADGIYTFKLRVASANSTGGDVPIYVSLTQAGIGNVLMKASDIYTGTLNQSGQRIAGMSGARITLQNEAVATVTSTLTTDSLGEAYFTGLPSGRYKFRATAPNHQEVIGRLSVKPGITVSQDIFLDYNLVNVEWSVTPVTIKDTYTITPLVTFVANVPAPVVLLEPLSVTLPTMKPGDVFLGEFTLTNYGLVRADNVVFNPPASDAFFRYEFMANVPTSLEAKQRITIPYRVVSLTSLDQPVATGGGCSAYQQYLNMTFSYACANGNISSGSATAMFYVPPTGCPAGTGGGGGGGGFGGGGFGGGGGGGFSGGGSAPQSMPGAACVPPPCDTCSGNGGGSGGAGQ